MKQEHTTITEKRKRLTIARKLWKSGASKAESLKKAKIPQGSYVYYVTQSGKAFALPKRSAKK